MTSNDRTSDAGASEANVCDSPTALAKQMEEVEAVVRELQKLLVRHELRLDAEGVRERLLTLERWAETFRRGLKAAGKISEMGPQWLREAQDKLRLAADELQRMDDESPAESSTDNAKKAEEYLRATRRIDKLIPAVDHALKAPHNQNDEPVPEKDRKSA